MPESSPKWHFDRGMVALKSGNPREAARHFAAAIHAEKQLNVLRPQMRYSSYYWLSSALVNGTTHDAIRACEMAVVQDGFDPDLRWNLARVYMLAGKKTQALATLEKGLRVDPTHRRMKASLQQLDRRARLPFPRLGRDHPVNRSLGRLRASLTRRTS